MLSDKIIIRFLREIDGWDYDDSQPFWENRVLREYGKGKYCSIPYGSPDWRLKHYPSFLVEVVFMINRSTSYLYRAYSVVIDDVFVTVKCHGKEVESYAIKNNIYLAIEDAIDYVYNKLWK